MDWDELPGESGGPKIMFVLAVILVFYVIARISVECDIWVAEEGARRAIEDGRIGR
jgi:hypothetical protein